MSLERPDIKTFTDNYKKPIRQEIFAPEIKFPKLYFKNYRKYKILCK